MSSTPTRSDTTSPTYSTQQVIRNRTNQGRHEGPARPEIKTFCRSPVTGQDGHFAIILEKEDADDLPDDQYPGIQVKDGEIRRQTYNKTGEPPE